MGEGSRWRAFTGWLVVAVGIAVLDQLAKEWALAALEGVVPLAPSVNLVLVHNPGAAFGLFAQASGWQRWFFIIVGVAIAGFVIAWLGRAVRAGRGWLSTGLALALGGALGNLWDRFFRGSVVDFVDLYYGSFHWPTFNVADSAITAGVALIVLCSFRDSARR